MTEEREKEKGEKEKGARQIKGTQQNIDKEEAEEE